MLNRLSGKLYLVTLLSCTRLAHAEDFRTFENEEEIRIESSALTASVRKQGYVTGIAAQSLVDRTTGARDAGFGLDIVDWIMEPGSDELYRGQLEKELVYEFGNAWHGQGQKRSIEGPQICTQAREMKPTVTVGTDFIAVHQQFRYRTAAPGKKTGSLWTQLIVFPAGKRWFVSMDRIDAANSSDGMFLRLDMPGHIKHDKGDSFEQVYLSYHGLIPSTEFLTDFAPDEKFNFQRERDGSPRRMIRAYLLRDPKSGKTGPWLAGMTLDPTVVSEAWCHQRGYVCMIEEFGGRPIKVGESFSAAFIVGYFDSIDEMQAVYDEHQGHTVLEINEKVWTLK